MASSKETYCLCGQPYNIGQFMIECDCCREWFHGSCVDVKIYHSDDIDKYHCPKCAQTYGPSVLKIPTNNHRADRYELSAETRPSQVGTPAWVRALAARPLRPTHTALQRMKPMQFTEEFVRDSGFTRPVLFTTNEGLDMKVPNPSTFTVRSVLRFCGAQLEVEVIDVRKQSTLRMPLGDFVEYFETPPEHRDEKVLNVLSLEFSDTNLSPLVEPPCIALRLDWSESVWPAAEERPARPAVQKYCLMSPAAAYTDFHVDFGGTTVWYHVLHGRKIFYVVPPTSTNLALYQQWSASNNQNERFFGDMVEWYGTVELNAGQTLFIPTGWIHAVLTPCDSLVFGGNFLHSYAIEMQLQVYEIERRVETPFAYRYPLFEAMHWYAGAHLLTLLRRHNEETQDEDFTLSDYSVQSVPQQIPPLLLRGIKILANALKEWHALKNTDSAKRDNVPKCLNSGQLVRELCKELRTLEKRSASAANKDKDIKVKNTSPKKGQSKSQVQNKQKSLKLTLPKPIMHMAHNNGEYPEDKVYAEKFFIDNKEVIFEDNRFIQDSKYIRAPLESKEVVYSAFDEMAYQLPVQEKVIRVKTNTSPSSSREQPPPPYPLPEHSILKSHLIRNDRPTLKPIQQWTISKKDIGDYQEEQILFTNDNLQQDMSYGPGMYSGEDLAQDYQYGGGAVGVAAGAPPPEFSYADADAAVPHAHARYELPHHIVQPQAYAVPVQEAMNGSYQHPLPSYDAAIAQQYATTNYVEEEKPRPNLLANTVSAVNSLSAVNAVSGASSVSPAGPGAVRRSERAVRRRVSNSFDYEDADLYIDETPAPRRKQKARANRPRAHVESKPAPNSTSYRPAARPVPTNGIESLIQASVLAEEEAPVTDTEDAAVAGMLSIGSRFATHAFSHAQTHIAQDTTDNNVLESNTPASSSKRARKPATAGGDTLLGDSEPSDEEDVIKEVHRDDEYVYPSLEMSSDEEDEWPTRRKTSRSRHDSRSKSDKDESWSPRARVGRLVPRVRAPPRPARRECVRAALTAAAAAAPHAHRHRDRHTHAPAPAHAPAANNAKRAVLATKSKRPPPPAQPTPNNKNIRLKKGMKTAKQRLGKILKIHKMIY